ncbi:hypothetical protein ACOMHN_032152 [Nucella lapillus]
MTSHQKRILLWAVPRSLSSAMCRVMMNSGLSTQILFEPYSLSYYFGPERFSDRYPEVYPDPKYSYDSAKRIMEQPYLDSELVFAKDMPYYLDPDRLTADWIPEGYTHTFITRHPRSTVASYFKVIDKQMSGWGSFDPSELGFKEQLDMMRLLQENGEKVVVLDADDLMDNPEGVLRAYCQEVGLEFQDSMINWQPLSEKDFQDIFCPVWEEEWFLHLKTASKLNRRPKSPNSHSASYAKYDQETQDLIGKTVEENLKYFEEIYDMRIAV